MVPALLAAVAVATVVAVVLAVLVPSGRVLEASLVTLPLWPIPIMSSGVLSRLFVGNAIVAIVAVRWLMTRGSLRLPLPHVGRPLTALIMVGIASLTVSLLDPVPGVIYDYPQQSVPRWLIVATEIGLLTNMWLAPRIGASLAVGTELSRIWASLYIGASLCSAFVIGSWALGTGPAAILGHRRPGSDLYWIGMATLPFMMNDLLRSTRNRGRLMMAIGLCVIASALSFSRQAWIFTVLAVSVPVLIRVRRKGVALLAISGSIVAVGLAGAFDFYNPDRVYGLERTNFYAEALSLFTRHPVLGVGSGNYQFFSLADENVMQGGIAHNQFLTALAESGFLMIPVLAWLVVGIIAVGRGVSRDRRPGAYGLIAAWLSSWFSSEMAIPTTAAGGNSHLELYVVFIWLLIGILLRERPIDAGTDSSRPVDADSLGRHAVRSMSSVPN